MHWTPSRLKDYEMCPARYKYRYIDGLPSPSGPAADRGTRIHNSLEAYVKGETDEMDPEVRPAWRTLVQQLRDVHKANAEEMLELERGWYPLEAGGELWLRVKIDVWYVEAPSIYHVIDYKTGKPYAANIEQVEIYSLVIFANHEDAEVAKSALWYLDSDEPHEKTIYREDAGRLARKWEQRAGRMLDATSFPAKPNRRICSWCPFKQHCPDAA